MNKGRRIAIMQPYFFPYLGYFSLIAATDFFVFFDTAQYTRKSWMTRNRILKPGGGWQYFNLGVEKPAHKESIKNVKAREEYAWKEKIIRQLDHYKRVAPFFSETISLLNAILFTEFGSSMTSFNCHSIKMICDYLGIDFSYEIFSESNYSSIRTTNPGMWAPLISKAYGYQNYVNPPGGKSIFSHEDFREIGVNLYFLTNNLIPYTQRSTKFIPGLSIVDVLMFNSIEETRKLIGSYKIEREIE